MLSRVHVYRGDENYLANENHLEENYFEKENYLNNENYPVIKKFLVGAIMPNVRSEKFFPFSV